MFGGATVELLAGSPSTPSTFINAKVKKLMVFLALKQDSQAVLNTAEEADCTEEGKTCM